jgi:hypothetical protein
MITVYRVLPRSHGGTEIEKDRYPIFLRVSVTPWLNIFGIIERLRLLKS